MIQHGALPGGIGWYRKTFAIPEADKEKLVFIDFDGVYQKSEIWINDHRLGMRPYGNSSFRFEITPYLNISGENTGEIQLMATSEGLEDTSVRIFLNKYSLKN